MTNIEWTDETWNPTRGCSRVSEGCRNCYAERVALRFSGPGQPYEGLAKPGKGSKWTGEVRLVPEMLSKPLHWRKPRRVFVNSMSDLFHERLDFADIASVFGVMAFCPQHTFQVLTKRPGRMREFFGFHGGEILSNYNWWLNEACLRLPRPVTKGIRLRPREPVALPLPNVWLGVSVEDQATADERIPLLLETPAAVRFVSYEPALGPVKFTLHGSRIRGWDEDWKYDTLRGCEWASPRSEVEPGSSPSLDWIIAGSESGPGARPAELGWFRSVRDQCEAAAVPFFFKQWVGHPVDGISLPTPDSPSGRKVSLPVLDGRQHAEWPR